LKVDIIGPTSAQLCGPWQMLPGSAGSFTGIAAFWGEHNSSKATFMVAGGTWRFEHAEITSAGIDVINLAGFARVLLARCVAGGMVWELGFRV
jgi:hypothetical protein